MVVVVEPDESVGPQAVEPAVAAGLGGRVGHRRGPVIQPPIINRSALLGHRTRSPCSSSAHDRPTASRFLVKAPSRSCSHGPSPSSRAAVVGIPLHGGSAPALHPVTC